MGAALDGGSFGGLGCASPTCIGCWCAQVLERCFGHGTANRAWHVPRLRAPSCAPGTGRPGGCSPLCPLPPPCSPPFPRWRTRLGCTTTKTSGPAALASSRLRVSGPLPGSAGGLRRRAVLGRTLPAPAAAARSAAAAAAAASLLLTSWAPASPRCPRSLAPLAVGAEEEAVEAVFARGTIQSIHDKQVRIQIDLFCLGCEAGCALACCAASATLQCLPGCLPRHGLTGPHPPPPRPATVPPAD